PTRPFPSLPASPTQYPSSRPSLIHNSSSPCLSTTPLFQQQEVSYPSHAPHTPHPTHARALLSLQDRMAGLRARVAAAASAEGRAGQRVAHCFLDALTCRLHGTGALRLYNAAFTSQDMLQSRHVYFTTTPFVTFLYATAYSAILQTLSRSSRPTRCTAVTTTACSPAFDPCAPLDTLFCPSFAARPAAASTSSSSHCSNGSGEVSCSEEATAGAGGGAGVGGAAHEARAKRQRKGMQRALHIVDFGVYLGGQWSVLLRRLACLPGGPPGCVRITTIDNCFRAGRASTPHAQVCTGGRTGAGAGKAAACGANGFMGRGVGDVQVEEVGGEEQCWVAECERQKHEELGRMLTAQLTAEAAALGIERFEHRVVTINKDNLADSLAQVEGRRRWRGSGGQGGNGTRRMGGRVQEGGVEEWRGEGCEEEEEEEVVAVCCCLELQYFHDSSVMRSNPRDTLLKWVSSLAPDIFTFMEFDLSANGPFFLSRLRNCLDYHAALFECHEHLSANPVSHQAPVPTKLHQQCNQDLQQRHHLSPDAQPCADGALGSASDTTWSHVCMSSLSQATAKPASPTSAPSPLLEAPTRRDHILAFERAFFGYNIVNMVATEGMQRSVRPESLAEWAQRIRHAGFVPLPVPADVLEEAYGTIRSTPPGLGMLATEGAVQLTWHGRPLLMCTLWQVPWVMG
ncbi:unnamed protein product, partial [Closterium sp. NIES-54]